VFLYTLFVREERTENKCPADTKDWTMAATNPLETSERAAATGPDALASVAHRPWHRGDYIARLCSFRSRWWMGKVRTCV